MPSAPQLSNIRFLEETALSAWPALQTAFVDGWVLRFADGYTRRANSVSPLYAGSRSFDENLAECETLYASRQQPAVFKLTAAAQPPDLDERLAQRRYSLEAPTSVQTLEFEPNDKPLGAAPGVAGALDCAGRLPDVWLGAVCEMNAVSERHAATLRQMLTSLVPPACFASLVLDGQITACGLGVLHAGWLGLFDIVTHPRHRRQGHARRLIEHLLAWGRARAARGAYLQVALHNQPALALYRQLGFREAYPYWYRVKTRQEGE